MNLTAKNTGNLLLFVCLVVPDIMAAIPAGPANPNPPWYIRKDSWLDTMRESREAIIDHEGKLFARMDQRHISRAKSANRGKLVDLLLRDFPVLSQEKGSGEEIAAIWSRDWKQGDLKDIARRYANACTPAMKKDAQKMAADVTSPDQLLPVRALYRKSWLFNNAVKRMESVNIRAVLLAIADMEKTWPDSYDAGTHKKAVENFSAKSNAVITALRDSQPEALPEANMLIAGVHSALLSNPLLAFDRCLLIRRGLSSVHIGLPQNWQGNSSLPKKGYDNEIAIMSLKDPERELTPLFKPGGGEFVGDLCLHFDADRLLFSSIATNSTYQVFEIGIDGRNPRQVTPDQHADVDNYDACYLPDGDIIFSSTATYLGVPCVFGSSHIANFYRLDTRTGSIRQLTFEQEHDWNPVVLPNGRVLYQRWEYTDAAHSNSRLLFHMNPDGTEQRAYSRSGSFFPGSFFYARPLPGNTRHVIGIATGHHGVPRSGRLLILDPAQGQRDGDGIVQEIPGYGEKVDPIVRDSLISGWPQFLMPFPLNDKYHLVTAKLEANGLWGIYLADIFDNLTLIKEVEGSALFQPIPIQKVKLPPAIPPRVNLAINTATAHIADIYAGPGLEGAARGTVKKIRVYEYYFSHRGYGGLYGSLGFDGPWDIRRIIGTVPVEPDGSAYFTIPANSAIALQPLDEKGQAMQIMRSWLTAMPGEHLSCVGCHESPLEAPITTPSEAFRRKPSLIEPWHGPTRGFSFKREVQPVLNRYCVGCHGTKDLKTKDGNMIPNLKGEEMLSDWKTAQSGHWHGGGKFSKTYYELQRFVRRPGIESDRRMASPMDFHFSTTELGQILNKGHHGIRLDAESWERLAAWADMNAPYYGTWGEIPPYNEPGQNQDHVKTVVARARDLRRQYASAGPFPNFEEIPETPEYDTKPVPPSVICDRQSSIANVNGWPFDTATAMKKQKQTAPESPAGITALTLGTQKLNPIPCRYIHVGAGSNRWLSLAEVQVFSHGENIAPGKTASQSSIYGKGKAELALDGNADGIYANGSITHTMNGTNEWWEVDLGAMTPIDRIVLWNRTDCAMERLAGCTVSLLDEKRNSIWNQVTEAKPGRTIHLLNDATVFCKLTWIPAGEFIMGSTGGHMDEAPASPVKIKKGFWMSRFEISNAMFLQFNPRHESRTEDRHGYQFGITGYDQDQPDQPAVRVSWEEAMDFCKWLAEKTGKKVSLPTEAQWEWACRAGTSSPFWYGNLDTDFSKTANLGDAMLANFAASPYVQDWKAAAIKDPGKYDNWIPQDPRFNDGGFITEPVGRYSPNPWGLHDMHGNAWEWTRSMYKPYPYDDNDGRNNVAGSSRDIERVVRGGSWYDRPFKCTSSYRVPYKQFQRIYNVGFRIIVED